MSQDYDARESDFATAIAAAAFVVHLLDQAELQYQQKRKQEALEISRSKAKSKKDEIAAEIPSSSRPTRLFSDKEAKTAGAVSMRMSVGQEDKVSERASPAKQPSRASSVRQATPADRYQMQKGTSSRQNGIESRADAWEKTRMKKVQSWYEKLKSTILAWENEKKMQAKLKMKKRKSLLEQRMAQNMQHYQNKVVRIEKIVGGARAQLEDKRRNEELAVKEKANKIRSGGNVPLKCFCFTC